MKLRVALTALLVSMSLAAVPACKKDKPKADDKATETTTPTTDTPAEPPAGDPAAAGAAKVDPAAPAGDEAKAADPAAGGEPTEVKKDEGEKKEGGW